MAELKLPNAGEGGTDGGTDGRTDGGTDGRTDGRTEPTSDLFAHDLAEKNKTKVQALAGNHLEPSDAPSSPPRPSPLLLLNLDQPQL